MVSFLSIIFSVHKQIICKEMLIRCSYVTYPDGENEFFFKNTELQKIHFQYMDLKSSSSILGNNTITKILITRNGKNTPHVTRPETKIHIVHATFTSEDPGKTESTKQITNPNPNEQVNNQQQEKAKGIKNI